MSSRKDVAIGYFSAENLTIDEALQISNKFTPQNEAALIEELKAFKPTFVHRYTPPQAGEPVTYLTPSFDCDTRLTHKQSALVKVIIKNYVDNQWTHPTLSKILALHATNEFLIVFAKMLKKDGGAYPHMGTILSPLTERILKIELSNENVFLKQIQWARGLFFSGNQEVRLTHFITGQVIGKYTEAETDGSLNQGEFGLARLIFKIHLKAESLRAQRGDKDPAYSAANTLYNELSKEYLSYLSQEAPKGEACQNFKSSANGLIETAEKELSKHRGWKNFLANIGLHIGLLVTTGGLGNIAALGVSYYQGNENLLFSLTKTDSSKKGEALSNYINRFAP